MVKEQAKYNPWIGLILTMVTLAVILIFPGVVGHSLSLTFVFVVLTVYAGGLRWGLGAAGLVIAAEVYLLLPHAEYGRFAVVSVTLLATVLLVASLQRRAAALDTVNGNIADLLKIMVGLQDILDDWNVLSRDDIRVRLKQATDGVVNLTTRVKGWHDIRREIEEVNRLINQEHHQ